MENIEEEKIKVNLDYFLRKEEFIESRRSLEEFKIMYKTYHGSYPSLDEIQNYNDELSGNVHLEEDDNWEEEYEEDFSF